MPSIRGWGSLLLGLLVVASYSTFVMSIIQILKVKRGLEPSYPAAVVAVLVASLLQSFYSVAQLATGGRGKAYVAKNVLIVNAVLFLFLTASMIAFTVLRNTVNYCGPDNTIRNDCSGVIKGELGLGWSAVGLQIWYLCFLPFLVKKHGNWADQMWNIPFVPPPNADMDKAPTH